MLINTKKKEENQLNSFLPEESFQHHGEISYTQLNARDLQMTILASCTLTSRSLYPTLVTLFCARASISNNSSLHDKNSAQILRAIYEMI
jgi:predicted nuclease of restriction endonuclease-like (RecB) superfamily